MNGPTVAQVKAAFPSLHEYLWALPFTLEAQMLYGLLGAGTVGMFAHYWMRWLRDEIQGSLWNYLFGSHFKGTMLSFAAFVGLAITSIQAGIFSTSTGEFVGWTTVLWFGVTQGFSVDAIANRTDRKPWTDEQRRAHAMAADHDEITIPPGKRH